MAGKKQISYQPESSDIKAFGLRSEAVAVLWFFDDDLNLTENVDEWGRSSRSYADSNHASKASRKVTIQVPNGSYRVQRFNTWSGTSEMDAYNPNPIQVADENGGMGTLELNVGAFSLDTANGAVTWDGTDVLLIMIKE